MKSKKAATVTVRVSETVKRDIAKLAEEEKRTVSNLVAMLLEEALQARS